MRRGGESFNSVRRSFGEISSIMKRELTWFEFNININININIKYIS